jgi:chromatin assembly factor 1 subunit B
MLESGFCQDSLTSYGHVLATSGNSSEINLWKLSFRDAASKRIIQNQPNTKIEHMLSLTRHDRSVNAIAFSPDGLHLATAGDGGSILVWSVPPSKRGNQNGRHFWSTLTKEGDLTFRLVSSPCEGICDISWSPDSKRFVVGSIDHCVQIYEDANYDTNKANPDKPQLESQWQPVYRNTRDHTHFVQGVAFDPLGVYVACMGSDCTVRVYARKPPPKAKKKVLRPKDANDGPLPPPEHQAMVEQLLIDSKLELGKAKTLKYREISSEDGSAPAKKQYLFADESTVESFFRRLNWTADGAFLVTPAALWHGDTKENDKENSESSSPSFATFLFARHKYDEPYKVLPGLEKVRNSNKCDV